MLTFAELKDHVEDLWSDTSKSTLVQTIISEKHQELLRELGIRPRAKTYTITTVADQGAYELPIDYDTAISVHAIVDENKYPVKPVLDRDQWNLLTTNGTSTSDYPQYFRINQATRKLEVWPESGSAGNSLVLTYRKQFRTLVSSDFTDKDAGTVGVTNDDATVSGSGTSFGISDEGRYIKTDTDGHFYEIDSVASATELELVRKWQASTASGESYKIGTLPEVPDGGVNVLVYLVLSELYALREQLQMASWYGTRAKERRDALKASQKIIVENPDMEPLDISDRFRNPNNFPDDITFV